ncbi:S8 family serine peptidase [Caulobacter sp. KR2-114]|uniref:S8 family serine peptidase n=1 Tax=Caulobacter sp. KR2-114 TaxID=3400912 RepID=UPI003BFF267E
MRKSILALMLALAATPACAQLLGGGGVASRLGVGPAVGGVGSAVQPVGQTLDALAPQSPGAARILADPLALGPVEGVVETDASALLDQRRSRLRETLRRNGRVLEAGPDGALVRRGEILATGLSAAGLAAATGAGFTVLRDERLEGADLRVTVLAPPEGRRLKAAVAALRTLAPGASIDFNAVYEPAGGPLATVAAARVAGSFPPVRPGVVIGIVDGGVSAHPALAGASIEQRGFAGQVTATGHGTAVASLLVGAAAGFSGAAQGANLLVADVYGGSVANGSAEAVARAIGWLIARHARVVSISLVGPPNAVVEAAVDAARAGGVLVVAAVGNDGPAAPPQYPASYAGVVAVTGVDAHDRALFEAGRAAHLDFAAPGAEIAAATPGGGFAAVRGTSFAAPLVAARLAAYAQNPLSGAAAEARPGHGAVGRGVICEACRNDPRPLAKKRG